jgi:hypothetical protein
LFEDNKDLEVSDDEWDNNYNEKEKSLFLIKLIK